MNERTSQMKVGRTHLSHCGSSEEELGDLSLSAGTWSCRDCGRVSENPTCIHSVASKPSGSGLGLRTTPRQKTPNRALNPWDQFIFSSMSLASLKGYIFKQASQTRKQTKPASFQAPRRPLYRSQLVTDFLPHSLGAPKAIRVLPKHLD